ncbi:MAG: Uma2 family endonuclease [Cytophagales bacterium]|jgi:Uma2 family endonuclease|nr:Uma2 family endonuclease [Cytophagales bacterium]
METTILHFSEELRFTDDEFYEFCQQNNDLKFERTHNGDIILMANTGGKTGIRNAELIGEFVIWNRKTQFGKVFDSSTAFRLPDTSVKSPDVAVVAQPRWDALTAEQQEKFPPVCPDFVVEIKSASDRLSDSQTKMEKWMENGCRLAWLIDAQSQTVYVYRKNKETEEKTGFNQILSGEDVLPEFAFDLQLLS